MPDGTAFFEMAHTLQKESRGYLSRQPLQSIGLGCEITHARDIVYADGFDLENVESARKIGVACRLCDRMDCEERAFAPVQNPLKIDENVRGPSFYVPPTAEVK